MDKYIFTTYYVDKQYYLFSKRELVNYQYVSNKYFVDEDSKDSVYCIDTRPENVSQEDYLSDVLNSIKDSSEVNHINLFLHASDFDISGTIEKKLNKIEIDNLFHDVETYSLIENKLSVFVFKHQDSLVESFLFNDSLKSAELSSHIGELIEKISIPDADILSIFIEREQVIAHLKSGIVEFPILSNFEFQKSLNQTMIEKDSSFLEVNSYYVKILKKVGRKVQPAENKSCEYTKAENIFYTDYFNEVLGNNIKKNSDKEISKLLGSVYEMIIGHEAQLSIIFISAFDLTIKEFYDQLFKVIGWDKSSDSFQSAKPVLVLGFNSLFENHNSEWSNNLELEKFFNYCCIKKNYRIIDSSIWIRYVTIDNQLQNNLVAAINEIKSNYELKLYDSDISIEFLDLTKKLFDTNLLASVSAHGSDIMPFIFHSESFMKEKAIASVEEIATTLNQFDRSSHKTLTWRCLLIDDNAKTPLNIKNIRNGCTKLEVVLKSFRKFNADIQGIKILIDGVSNEEINQDDIKIVFQIETAHTIHEAIELLSGEHNGFDIIFLDYLLGKVDTEPFREYSHQFLFNISCCLEKSYDKMTMDFSQKEIEGVRNNKLPFNKFWIINTSTFQTAFIDRLREQGLGHNSEHWYLSSGGDLVNTPFLFIQSIMSILEMQFSHVFCSKDHLLKILDGHSLSSTKDVPGWAKSLFGILLYNLGKRQILENDSHKGSEFAKSVLKSVYNKSNITDLLYFDYFRQLLYRLAYESGNSLNQMWELFKLIKGLTPSGRLSATFQNIKNYLSELERNY